jgi:hydroxylamine dehydrogenase
VEEYNEVYFKPAKSKLTELYEKGLLDKTKFFDERLEVEYYELWHHEGRRARMGAMMMAPDYAWWHGFYECKLRFANYMEEANHLIETMKRPMLPRISPMPTGDTTRPPAIFGTQNKPIA